MSKKQKRRKYWKYILAFLVLGILFFFLLLGIRLGTRNNTHSDDVSPGGAGSNYPTMSVSGQNPTGTNPMEEVINGSAYLSPNTGEGISVRYQFVEDGYTYHPFLPLEHTFDSSTKITNSKNQKIQFASIKIGDNLIVHTQRLICYAGIKGGQSGCQIKIFSIQDVSL